MFRTAVARQLPGVDINTILTCAFGELLPGFLHGGGEGQTDSAHRHLGLKYLDQLGELLQQLHDVGCERDRAGNRLLHMDQYCMLILLYMFNPVVTLLRGLQQASELKKVQKKLGCVRASLGSLSESVAVFDLEKARLLAMNLCDASRELVFRLHRITRRQLTELIQEFDNAADIIERWPLADFAPAEREAVLNCGKHIHERAETLRKHLTPAG